MYVWAVFESVSEFDGSVVAQYANPFVLTDGRVLAHAKLADWSGETLPHDEAVALIDEQPIEPPPDPGPGPGPGE